MIRHTEVEKALYEVARVEGRDKEMFQLCSHPQISNNQCRHVHPRTHLRTLAHA